MKWTRPAVTLWIAAMVLAHDHVQAGDGGVAAEAIVRVRADDTLVRQVSAILERGRTSPSAEKEVVRDLVALGPHSTRTLLAILSGSVEPVDTDPASMPLGALRGAESSLFDALRRFPPAAVSDELVAASRGAPLSVRLVALKILGETADATGPDAWAAILADVPSEDLARAFVAGPVEDCLTAILSRHRAAAERFARGAKSLDPRLAPAAARAIAKSAAPRAMDALVALLNAGSQPEVVAAMGELGAACGARPPEWALDRIRRAIGGNDVRLARAAATAISRLGDANACPMLIDGLAAVDGQLATACNAALARLAGGDRARTPDDWRAWYVEETGWYDRHANDLLLQIGERDPASALDAVRELCSHPLYQDRVAAAVAALLARPEPNVAKAAAVALGELGSRTALPALVDALTHPAASVREATRTALRRLTGKDFPAESAPWKVALGL